MAENSYTAKLMKDRDLLVAKLLEEADEVATAYSKENLRWELGDLTYFMSVLAVVEGLEWQDVLSQLSGRHR